MSFFWEKLDLVKMLLNFQIGTLEHIPRWQNDHSEGVNGPRLIALFENDFYDHQEGCLTKNIEV